MYGIFRIEDGDINRIFRDLNQLDCWRRLIGEHVDLGQQITSPFRSDSKPGCYLQQHNGVILFKDFQRGVLHNKTVLHAYCSIYQCSYHAGIQKLRAGYFPPRNGVKIVLGEKAYSAISEKATIEIQSFIRKGEAAFPKEHEAFWTGRKITTDILQGFCDHRVFAVHSWSLNGSWELCKRMTFAYVFANGHTKIYVPGSKRKFLVSTTTTDDIWKWEQPGNDKLIIDKSFKDACHDVRLMPGYDVWAFQAERHIPEVIPDFSKYKKILIKGDNDTTGVMSVEKLLQRIGKGIPLFLPPKLGNHKIKDTDDAVVNGFEQYAKNLMECHLK